VILLFAKGRKAGALNASDTPALLLYPVHRMSREQRGEYCGLFAVVSVALLAFVSGCGTPGAPLPPSLDLPDRVTDLSATRAGNRVSLAWTMPKRNTDRIPLKGTIEVEICRQQGRNFSATLCEPAGKVRVAPATTGTFIETLPVAVTAGPPRELIYHVELKNGRGRSAGLSNEAIVVAGEAPPPVTGLTAEVRRGGVILRWEPVDPGASIRLHRTLLTPAKTKPSTGPLASSSVPIEESLLVNADHAAALPAQALDNSIIVGNMYEYRAQRIVRIPVGDQTIELAGEVSPPIRVEAADVFPPAVPQGLVAVATGGDAKAGTSPSVDLNWQPNTEPDLAGYDVYRRDEMTAWQRVSGGTPVPGPAYHDDHVLPGHTYRYSVSAVDRGAHESGRSAETTETVPNE
jgi:hypothetical protein